MTPSLPFHIDIFCAVIDNFGDAGVCWRLARQFAVEHGCQVRLWLDRPEVLAQLCQGEQVGGVVIGDWRLAALAEPAPIVIEAFACNPPAEYIARMSRCARTPAWINLEYLSAESWVEDSHRMASRHPQLGLDKHFYFPGFNARTGGLIKEADLDVRRDRFVASDFWPACGAPTPRVDALCVSLFAYENVALPALLDAWAKGTQPVYCAVPVGRSLPAITAWSGEALQAGSVIERGALQLVVLPFLTQRDYDRLLWACDLNFVRGEDSFVRAQWAHQPFVWHIYQQEEDAHLIKLDAFLAQFVEGLSGSAKQALVNFWQAWEEQGEAGTCWPALREALPELRQHGVAWAERVASHGDLCSNMLIFCKDLLE